jgi:hypothetical protein
MKRLFCLVILISLFCTLCCENIFANDDWEFWNMETIKMKLNDKFGLTLIEEFRFNENMNNFYTHVQYIGPTYTFNEYVGIGILYQTADSKTKDDWNTNHRFDLDLYTPATLYDFKFDGRTRFERDMTANTWTYRGKLQISHDVMLCDRKFIPYISNEAFVLLDPETKYNENRAEIGIKTGFIFGTDISLYYMSRMKKSKDDWHNANILGVNMSYKF